MRSGARPPIAVIGIGNVMRRDDGVGPATIDALGRGDLDDVDLVVTDGEMTGLLEAWRDRRLAIVIDAVKADSPSGTIHRTDPDLVAVPVRPAGTSSHAAGLAAALALARAVDRLPERLIVYGVEPADLEHGPGLSRPVAAAVGDLVERIDQEIDALRSVAPEHTP